MKQETGRQQPGIPFLQGGEDVNRKIYTYKSKAAAVLLALCLGAIGAHRFYLGNVGLGVAYIVATLVLMVAFPPALMGITVLLCLEAVYFLCQGKGYYKRELMVEVGE